MRRIKTKPLFSLHICQIVCISSQFATSIALPLYTIACRRISNEYLTLCELWKSQSLSMLEGIIFLSFLFFIFILYVRFIALRWIFRVYLMCGVIWHAVLILCAFCRMCKYIDDDVWWLEYVWRRTDNKYNNKYYIIYTRRNSIDGADSQSSNGAHSSWPFFSLQPISFGTSNV